jgi:hypothetical protein
VDSAQSVFVIAVVLTLVLREGRGHVHDHRHDPPALRVDGGPHGARKPSPPGPRRRCAMAPVCRRPRGPLSTARPVATRIAGHLFETRWDR